MVKTLKKCLFGFFVVVRFVVYLIISQFYKEEEHVAEFYLCCLCRQEQTRLHLSSLPAQPGLPGAELSGGALTSSILVVKKSAKT